VLSNEWRWRDGIEKEGGEGREEGMLLRNEGA
jgi:hypothetical protein